MATKSKGGCTPIVERTRQKPTVVESVVPSPNYDGLFIFKGCTLRGMLNNAKKCFDRCRLDSNGRFKERQECSVEIEPVETVTDEKYITNGKFYDFLTLPEYSELIYYWLLINPNILSVSEFYNYPLDFAPYLYNPTTVMKQGNEAIYYLLEDRIQTAALHKQIDREVAMNLLREKYSWEKNNTQNVNLTASGAVVDFQFGDANLNNPTSKNDNK